MRTIPGRLAVSAGAGIAAAVLAAVAITVIDLYLTGHGYDSITREFITWTPADVHLSVGDLVMLFSVIAAAGMTWNVSGRGA